MGVGSGTAALSLMLQAASIGPGDEVIVPAHTFVASAFAVTHTGATPVCVDVKPGSGLIDPAAVRAAMGSRTAAIIAVHLYGQVCEMDEIQALAGRAGVAVFEDAAQAHGATYGGRRAGSLARASAFSFYPSKNLGALGDGGAVCTDDTELARAVRCLRDLGRSQTSHVLAGYNERLDALQAAFLAVKLPHLDRWNEARRTLASAYESRLDGIVELTADRGGGSVRHLFAIRTENRAALGRSLAQRGIAFAVHYPVALPDQPALAMLHAADTPVARDWAARELSLPMFAELTIDELDHVAAAVSEFADGVGRARPRTSHVDY